VDSFRLFIAIELPAEVQHKIRQHIDRLRAEFPNVRASWTREENLHLTLKFLGDVLVEKVETLSPALHLAASKITPFNLEITDCGAFPPRGKPNVLWIGTRTSLPQSPETPPSRLQISPELPDLSLLPLSPLLLLRAALEDECASVGFARDERAFHPHLTIARLRHPRGARDLAQLHEEIGFGSLSVKVKEVCLIRSELSSKGSRYTVLARHEFPRR